MLESIKPGDIVIRLMAEQVEVPMRVTEVDEEFIYVGSREYGWKFRRDSGGEVDEYLGWDGLTKTGSRLTGVKVELK